MKIERNDPLLGSRFVELMYKLQKDIHNFGTFETYHEDWAEFVMLFKVRRAAEKGLPLGPELARQYKKNLPVLAAAFALEQAKRQRPRLPNYFTKADTLEKLSKLVDDEVSR